MSHPESQPVTVDEAQRTILEQARAMPPEPVSLQDCAGRTLSGPLAVTQDSPPFDKALMDGFAVSSAAAEPRERAGQATVTLSLLETLTAGRLPRQTVTAAACSRIMTGARLPPGCDCVVPVEQVQFDGNRPDEVTIPRAAIQPEANLMRQGTAARNGSPLFGAGTLLAPQHIAALAEFGIAEVPVHRAARVAVMATGDELVHFSASVPPGCIRNSNEPMLIAQVRQCGAVERPLGIVRDTATDLSQAIRRGLQCDVLIVTGGVSAGMLDLVPQQLKEAGVRQVFHGVDMKPGKPLWFGVFDDDPRRCLVFGLPGNPVSSLACFELFVRPALGRLHGRSQADDELQRGGQTAILSEAANSPALRGSRPVYHPASISRVDGRLQVRLVTWSGSSDLRATVEANGMALLHANQGPYTAGTQVPVYFWGASQ